MNDGKPPGGWVGLALLIVLTGPIGIGLWILAMLAGLQEE